MNIDELSQKFTKCLAQIWRVHPFRDGNTRATLTFADIFAKQHGFEMDMGMSLDNLERIVDDETGKIKRFSVRDKFVLAALDEKDYPEPESAVILLKKGKKIREIPVCMRERKEGVSSISPFNAVYYMIKVA